LAIPAENLDYLHQMLNGWLLNISPYEHRLGLLRVRCAISAHASSVLGML
jgi:hypothetical protein